MVKELRWYGNLEEDVKKMDLTTFMSFIPTRARRSLRRGVTDQHKKLLKCVQSGDKNIKTHCRDMVIVPQLLGQIIRVYNGKEYLPVTITLEMLGHYLGEFSLTRKSVSHSAAGIGATRSSKAVSAR